MAAPTVSKTLEAKQDNLLLFRISLPKADLFLFLFMSLSQFPLSLILSPQHSFSICESNYFVCVWKFSAFKAWLPFGGKIGLFSDDNDDNDDDENDDDDNDDDGDDDNNNDKIVNQHTEMKWLEALRKKVNSDFFEWKLAHLTNETRGYELALGLEPAQKSRILIDLPLTKRSTRQEIVWKETPWEIRKIDF